MTPKEREVMEQALEALEWSTSCIGFDDFDDMPEALAELNKAHQAITAIKAALEAHKALSSPNGEAHPAVTESHKQEPVAWAMLHDSGDFIDAINPEEHTRIEGDYKHALYTTPPPVAEPHKRTWVGLTDEEYKNLHLQMGSMYFYQDYGRAIESKLKEKNNVSQ